MQIWPRIFACWLVLGSIAGSSRADTPESEQPAAEGGQCFAIEAPAQNACSASMDEYLAAYLYENPDVCLWDIDTSTQCIVPISTPSVPDSATRLPATNGYNDTSAIQSLLTAGGDFVGDGSLYRLNNLQITTTVRIWNMPSTPAVGAKRTALVSAPDVHIYNSLIDGLNSPGFYAGWQLNEGAHRFRLINSGVVNVNHTGTRNVFGVMGSESDDIHIACNKFENLISHNSSVRALWMAPGNTGSRVVRGGVFASNEGGNFQSNNIYDDADVVVLQSYEGRQVLDRPFLIMANRFINGGKRLVKWQTGNSKALSNFYHWKDAEGPLGRRRMAEAISSFTSNNIARNNHLKYSAEGAVPEAMFSMLGGSIEPIGDNNHFNCNTVEYEVDPPLAPTSTVMTGVNVRANKASTGYEFTNSSFTHNEVIGPGKPTQIFWFRKGWDNFGSSFEHSSTKLGSSVATRDYNLN